MIDTVSYTCKFAPARLHEIIEAADTRNNFGPEYHPMCSPSESFWILPTPENMEAMANS